MRAAGYHIEEDAMDKQNSLVVEIPVSLGSDIKTLNDVTMRDQLDMASFMQKYWADNQVSCTVTFDPKKEGHTIKEALNDYQHHLKGISFLPKTKNVYP